MSTMGETTESRTNQERLLAIETRLVSEEKEIQELKTKTQNLVCATLQLLLYSADTSMPKDLPFEAYVREILGRDWVALGAGQNGKAKILKTVDNLMAKKPAA